MTGTDHELADVGESVGRVRRRRWPCITSGVLAVTLVMVTAVFQYGPPWWMHTGDRNHVFTSDDTRQRYQVHLPPQYDGSTPLPVIVAIHGRGMTGYGWNSIKSTT